MANNQNEEYLDKDYSEEEDDEINEEEEREIQKLMGESMETEMVEEHFDDDWVEKDKNKLPFDNFFIGLFGGAILYLIAIRLVTWSELSDLGMKELLLKVYNSTNFGSIMMSAMLPNLIAFFVLYKLERWQTNYGMVVFSLLISAFIFLHIV